MAISGIRQVGEGVLFAGLGIAAITGWLSPPLALALGVVFALTLNNPIPAFSHKLSKILLQASVVGLGFGLNLQAVWLAGRTGFAFTVATIFGALFLGLWIGRLLKVESQTALLVSSGTAICGGSAIAAVGAVIGADKKAMSVSLATVFILNAVALFIFPPLGHLLHMDQHQFGLWSAIAIHDTSSVVGAASKYGTDALAYATTVKLSRALWIFPIALGLAFIKHRKSSRVAFPWFILFFLVAAGVRTVCPQGVAVYDAFQHAARSALVLTLFLIGTGLSRDAIRKVGFRPMIQGMLLWLIVSTVSLAAVTHFARP